MIKRLLTKAVQKSASLYPIVGIIGPRQSGKTTLSKFAFPDYQYVNFENPATRAFAQKDPLGFLDTYKNRVIIDEVQRVPDFLSYLQVHTDTANRPGQFILTGSQNFLFMKSVSQSLAGRIALHTLLPLSAEELPAEKISDYYNWIYSGGYPRVYQSGISPTQWYGDYMMTYIDKDVRLLSSIANLSAFEKFVRLCAGRIGQLVNFSSLASDAGISHNTARDWVSLLEASYVLYLLKPYYRNFNKRLVKSPKLYFYDTGLASWLLDITSPEQLKQHFAVGSLFENLVISEYLKFNYNRGLNKNPYFWRDKTGHEIDMLIENGNRLTPVEIKAGSTVAEDYWKNLKYLTNIASLKKGYVIYGGRESQFRTGLTVYPMQSLTECFKDIGRI